MFLNFFFFEITVTIFFFYLIGLISDKSSIASLALKLFYFL